MSRKADVAELIAPLSPIAVSKPVAAASLGMGLDAFQEHVAPNIRLIRCGRLRLVPVAELQRWAAENATTVFE